MSVASDATLIRRTLGGDLDAFDRLVRRHRAQVLRVTRGVLHDAEAAEDAAQDALLEAYSSLPTLREPARLPGWLATIARRVASRVLRGWKTQEVESVWRGGSPPRASTVGPAQAQVAERVREALAELSARHRRIMVLHYLQGFECAEIAALLGVPAGTVKRVLHEGRQQVREECGVMPKATRPPVRPLVHWISGSFDSRNPSNIFALMNSVLPQTICLCVNRQAKSLRTISREVGAHAAYVAEHIERLLVEEVLVQEGDRYRANFPALDAADWVTLTKDVRRLGRAAANALKPHLPRLKAAFRGTPVAREWPWEEVIWPVVALFVCNLATRSAFPPGEGGPPPLRHSGTRYWFAGHEKVNGRETFWTTGFNSWWSNRQPKTIPFGYYWSYGLNRRTVEGSNEAGELLWALTHGCRTVEAAAEHVEGGLAKAEAVAAEWVAEGLLRREKRRLRLNFPLFTAGERQALDEPVLAAGRDMVEQVLRPGTEGLEQRVAEMGYAHVADQLGVWPGTVRIRASGEAVHCLLEDGLLPRPDDPAPARFAFIAWDPEVGLPGGE